MLGDRQSAYHSFIFLIKYISEIFLIFKTFEEEINLIEKVFLFTNYCTNEKT